MMRKGDPRYVMLRNSSAQPAPIGSAVGYMYDRKHALYVRYILYREGEMHISLSTA
jgi:hypothetical protein